MELLENAKSRARELSRRVKRIVLSQAKKHLSTKEYIKCKRRYFEGALCKPKPKQSSYAPSTTYSVVIAVCNSAFHLDDCLESLTAQTMDLSALQIVVVDDGSGDGSVDIIERWQRRCPEIIEYHRGASDGRVSARNLGLEFATGEWVTFIDSEDFVSPCYFEEVDRAVVEHSNLQMVSCRVAFFYEASYSFSDTHPLGYRFKKGESLYDVDDDRMPPQIAVNGVFFRREAIETAALRIEGDEIPDFEGIRFVGRYLLSLSEGCVSYLRRPVYYCRQRAAGGFTSSKSWESDDALTTVLQRGSLDLLERAREEKGSAPRWLQDAVLYQLSWYFKYFDNRRNRAQRFLVSGAAARFWELAAEIFEYIDDESIAEISGAWINFSRKAALLSTFKGRKISYHIFYVRRIDFERGFMLLSSADPSLEISYNGQVVNPLAQKECPVFTLGRHFYSNWLLLYPLPGPDDTISYRTGSHVPTTLSLGKEMFAQTASSSDIFRCYKKGWEKYEQQGDLWMFMDRDTQADDNAEHLYRWVARNHPEKEIAFALRRESPDWNRLSAEGFNLVDFGSLEHEQELRRCSAIISAHADSYVHSYFGDDFYKSKKYIFLQHGLTVHDISPWINGKPIDLMITASQRETESIIGNESPYLLMKSQVALAGFPRHDALIKKGASREKDSILIMPTWRKALCNVGKTGKEDSLQAGVESDASFMSSPYKKSWENLLRDARLRELAAKSGKRIVFFPHTNMFFYIESGMFEVPDYVEIKSNQTGSSIQETFARAALFVTDFSSTAFEAAYIERPCVYYQFDKDTFYEGQAYTKGYFDYGRDGFGPVVKTLDDAIAAIEGIADRGFKPAPEHLDRMRSFFVFHDGKCCERVYEAIESLFKPL